MTAHLHHAHKTWWPVRDGHVGVPIVHKISSSRGILLQYYKSTKGCQGRKYAHLRGVSAISEYLRHLIDSEVVERILFRGKL